MATTKQKIIISKIRKNCPLKSSYVAPRAKADLSPLLGAYANIVLFVTAWLMSLFCLDTSDQGVQHDFCIVNFELLSNEPRCEKTCLLGFRPGPT